MSHHLHIKKDCLIFFNIMGEVPFMAMVDCTSRIGSHSCMDVAVPSTSGSK